MPSIGPRNGCLKTAWRNRARSCSAHNDFRRSRVALKFSINCSFGGGFNGCTPFGAFTRSRRDATILVGIKRRIMDKRCGGCASDCSRELMTYCSTRERWCTTSATLHSFSDGRRVKRSSSIAPTRSRRPRWVESSLASVLFNQVVPCGKVAQTLVPDEAIRTKSKTCALSHKVVRDHAVDFDWLTHKRSWREPR